MLWKISRSQVQFLVCLFVNLESIQIKRIKALCPPIPVTLKITNIMTGCRGKCEILLRTNPFVLQRFYPETSSVHLSTHTSVALNLKVFMRQLGK